jgi:hypothetical protein
MNKQLKSKTVGFETTPKFNAGMIFCVHMNTIPVALKDYIRKELSQEKTERKVQTVKEDLIGINSLKNPYEHEDRLIQRQDETIKALEKQLADEEQELFEKDKLIAQLENALEEVCEKFFLEVTPQ